jgi:uncharacterized circularly permuted ATP-grasp superfamily protein/uncharacterized alpha-E superfamily protein
LSPVENITPSLFAAQFFDTPFELAAALSPAAAPGHFDELRGGKSTSSAASKTLSPAATPALRLAGADEGGLPTGAQEPERNAFPNQSQSQSQGQTTAPLDGADIPSPLSPSWTRFFNFLGTDGFHELNHRSGNLQRQIRDNGVTYNVYADADGPQRPWSLDLFPMLVSAQDWAFIEAGVRQRAHLLDRVMADLYGPQQLLAKGLLPSALVHGHPGYLRAMHGVPAVGSTYLHIAAFDLAHGPDGRWSVVSQRTQAPSGLGYLLENRLSISRQFPEAFREMNVQPLAACYKALVDGLKAMSPAHGHDAGSRVVLLTPGPYNETYFEHAYLARFLGLTLVEGSDLTVRDERLYLKTLHGLEPVHGILKRLDDQFLDPLELRSDSTLGVPGLLQVIRAGKVLVVNTPGSAVLESTALLGFLPALSRHLLGETLALPSLPTWWCGEQAVLQNTLAQLKNWVIKPTYPASNMESVIGHLTPRSQLDEWAGRILRRGEDYTVQAYQPLSQTPTWHGERIAPRSAMLRVFAVADGAGSWQVLAGGLARLAGARENMSSMQHGGSSADVWVLGDMPTAPKPATASPPVEVRGDLVSPAANETIAPPAEPLTEPAAVSARDTSISSLRQKPPVTSRAAENLFWLGRYTERTENACRLTQVILQCLGGEDQNSPPLLAWLSSMARSNMLVLDTVPPATQARRVFERALIANLADTTQAASVGYNLKAIKIAAAAVRERLSHEQWQLIAKAEADFFHRCRAFNRPDIPAANGPHALEYSSALSVRALESAGAFLAAMTGAQNDRMTRDDGWRLLSIGRLTERLHTLSSALEQAFETGAVFEEGGFNAVLAFFDSTITFHAQYQQRRDIPALLDLLVLDRDNPRSLGWVVMTLRGRLAKLSSNAPVDLPDLTATLADPGEWAMNDLWREPMDANAGFDRRSQCAHLTGLLDPLAQSALDLSDSIGRRYFSHATDASQSLGA